MSKPGFFLLPLLFACPPGLFSGVEPVTREVFDAPEDVRAAVAVLRDTEEFASARVGVAGAPSRQVVAFRDLLRSDSAREAFEWLLANASLEGQLYALSGLYLTDRERFDQVVGLYQAMADSVTVVEGCLVDSRAVSVVVGGRSEGDSRETALDIAGGGWPLQFRDAEEQPE